MAWGLVWLMHHLVLIVSSSVFSPCMKWRGDALRPLQPPLSLRMLRTASLLLALVEDQKAFGKQAMTRHPDGKGGGESAP